MRLKETVRYQLHETVRPAAYYYLVMLAVLLLSMLAVSLMPPSVRAGAQANGADTSTAIFLFVVGLNMLKAPMKLLVQNGVSRRTQWIGTLLTFLMLSLALSLLDGLLPLVFARLDYRSTYGLLYANATWTPVDAVWRWMLYVAALSLGFLITTLYYRMGKALKIGVSVAVPLLLLVVLPLLETLIPSFRVFTALVRAVAWLLGVDMSGARYVPWRAVGTFAATGAVSMGLAWLLMRRAGVRL